MNTLTKNRGEGGTPTLTGSKSGTDSAPAWENPLIPNKKLRALYTAMAELRLLESHLNLSSPHGEEGCRASTIHCLNPGDLTSDADQGLTTAFLRGAKLPALLSRAQTAKQRRLRPAPLFPGQLPTLPDTADRLHLALGAAAALKSGKPRSNGAAKSSLAAIYLYAADLNPKQWSTVLTLASTHTLPLLLVVLPNRQKTQGLAAPGRLSHLADTRGVPGIPVDADDPVALYRVAQESTLRVRAGGGPVLMECIPFHLAGKKIAPADPLVTMQQFLLHRRIATDAWLHSVETSFAARLKSISP